MSHTLGAKALALLAFLTWSRGSTPARSWPVCSGASRRRSRPGPRCARRSCSCGRCSEISSAPTGGWWDWPGRSSATCSGSPVWPLRTPGPPPGSDIPRFLAGFSVRHAPRFEEWVSDTRASLINRYTELPRNPVPRGDGATALAGRGGLRRPVVRVRSAVRRGGPPGHRGPVSVRRPGSGSGEVRGVPRRARAGDRMRAVARPSRSRPAGRVRCRPSQGLAGERRVVHARPVLRVHPDRASGPLGPARSAVEAGEEGRRQGRAAGWRGRRRQVAAERGISPVGCGRWWNRPARSRLRRPRRSALRPAGRGIRGSAERPGSLGYLTRMALLCRPTAARAAPALPRSGRRDVCARLHRGMAPLRGHRSAADFGGERTPGRRRDRRSPLAGRRQLQPPPLPHSPNGAGSRHVARHADAGRSRARGARGPAVPGGTRQAQRDHARGGAAQRGRCLEPGARAGSPEHAHRRPALLRAESTGSPGATPSTSSSC